jgi:phosphate starvation-inducible PhoH-like protein|tara:strand:+ start:13413 stop:14393 length:981 start_codon:yes stop_codon:yes gene_type:complete
MATSKLHFQNPRQLSQLYCSKEENLRLVEDLFAVTIVTRDGWLQVDGKETAIERVKIAFDLLQLAREQGLNIKRPDFENIVTGVSKNQEKELLSLFDHKTIIKTRRGSIVPKTINQKKYLQAIFDNDIVFGIGPAGTGKTYLAMAAAVSELLEGNIKRLILSRPAVEAGETLGFLPGDLHEKILPYLRPLYDALYDMMDRSDVDKLIEKGVIEIAPLAYMRGRTLSDAFIILDEAQNTTPEQMMMFLTRLGNESKMVITGDITQIDIPRSKTSGLLEIRNVLKSLDGINFHTFEAKDVVRHHLVQKIVEAYDRYRNVDNVPRVVSN